MLLYKVNECNWREVSKTNFSLFFQPWVCLQMSNVSFVIVHKQKPVWKFSFSLGLESHLFAHLYRQSENKEQHSESFCR